jgi:methyl-accepting chemotaxis protein
VAIGIAPWKRIAGRVPANSDRNTPHFGTFRAARTGSMVPDAWPSGRAQHCPAMSLLERLPIGRKLLLLGAMVAIAVAIPLGLQLRQSNALLAATQSEAEGVAPARALMRLVQLAQQHRGLTAGWLGGNESFAADRRQRRQDVDQAIAAVDRELAARRYSAALTARWRDTAQAWTVLAADVDGRRLDAAAAMTRHSRLVAQYLRVLDMLLDDSGLVLDPEPHTYYLVTATLARLPAAAEKLAQTRGTGAALLAAGQVDIEGRAALSGLVRGAIDQRTAMELAFAKASASDAGLAAALRAPLAAASEPFDATLQLVDREIIKADALTYPAPQYMKSFTLAVDAMYALEAASLGELDQLLHQRIADQRRLQLVQFGLLGLMLLGVAWLARVIVRSITVPLDQAVVLAERVAAGDLTADAQVRGRDEVARLLASLRAMKDSLHSVVREVRSNADGVALASREISNGNTDLSRRTEQQAASLEETASSMEELSSTVRQNADHASEANRLAQEAQALAERGGTSVRQMVDTMEGIAAGSRRIADILGVIDGIAFQTNILALNAAVEAARAGEQGRGFAVVASEVRSLAQRSATAAREIKSLIAASQEQVERGSHAVRDTGDNIASVVGAIQRVAESVALISQASTEQSLGVGQISTAVAGMDQITQQNAALVEQAAAAAESLDAQARQLVSLMSRFKLGADHGVPG